jgi:Leucine-rich repeat (LRR) protein
MNDLTCTLPVTVLIQPLQPQTADWQVLGEGPGTFTIPPEMAVGVRIRNIGDGELRTLLAEIRGCDCLRLLNLSENRKITNLGMKYLAALTQITALNLSSCGISNTGLALLTTLSRLETLDISYCNRLTDTCVKTLRSFPHLTFLNLQGCSQMTHGGVARASKTGLRIKK